MRDRKRKNLLSDSLRMHEKLRGKLEVRSKVSFKNKKNLSLVYTPGVAEPCKEIAKDRKKVYKYTIKSNSIAVVSDGSAVLGLGNIGAEAALPVMEGKAILFKKLAGIDAFPICLSCQKKEDIIKTVRNIAPVFGGINLEDISSPKCFDVEDALQDLGIPVMHDDQHATAVVVLAGLINSLKLKKLDRKNAKIVIVGAGAAGIGIVKLLYKYGCRNLVLTDSQGAIYSKRKNLNSVKKEIAEITNLACKRGLDSLGCSVGDLLSSLKSADVFIGVSKANILNERMIRNMNENPIVFALANPVPEIEPLKARKAGAFIVATGRGDYPNQINNVLAFPGIFRGALDDCADRITDEMKISSAEVLASLVKMPSSKSIIPKIGDKRVVPAVSNAVRKIWRN